MSSDDTPARGTKPPATDAARAGRGARAAGEKPAGDKTVADKIAADKAAAAGRATRAPKAAATGTRAAGRSSSRTPAPEPAKSGGWRSRLTRTLAGGIREPAQLLEVLRDAAARGLMDADALAMVEGTLSMGGLQARDLMVPRADMVCIRREENLASILPAVVASGHSRFPVLDGDRDDVVGILLAKDLLRASAAGNGGGSGTRPRFDMREYLRPAVFVPEAKRLNVLLKEFRGNRNHMAIVVDEYGGVAGLITIEDVIEQVIGEIDDEFDVEDDQNIRTGADGRSTVRGATRIDEFNTHFGTAFPDDEFDTIAGLVMQQFGRVPRRGEGTVVGDYSFQVLRMDRRRIDALRVVQLEPPAEAGEGKSGPGQGGEAGDNERDAGG
jgi:magnesium and cobalt transporter